jgi:uncharacterized glyoxalase superfamily protein PhnB
MMCVLLASQRAQQDSQLQLTTRWRTSFTERGGRLRDPFGQQWMMSQHIEDVPAGEMARRAAAFFSGG